MSGFSMSDVKFRRCGEDECDIVVYGQLVGTLTRCPDDSLSGRKHVYWVHLYDDFRGPRRVLLEHHEGETSARETAQGWLADAERHVEAWMALAQRADDLAVPAAAMDDYPQWRDAARTLAGTGETVLGNEERYGAYLDALAAGTPRARLVVDQLRRRMKQPRNSVGEWLFAAGRHMEARGALEDAARHRRIYLTATKGYADWREEAERLMEEGGDILSEREAGRRLPDDAGPGERRMAAAQSALRGALREDDEEIAARKARARRERATERPRLGFADDLGGTPPEARTRAGTTDEVPEWAQPSRPRGAFGRDGQETFERSGLASLERWQRLKRDWNRQLEHAGEQGVHVIYTESFELFHQRLRSMAGDPHLETRICGKIGDVLRVLEEAQERRKHVETTRDRLLARLTRRREEPGIDGSRGRRAAPDRPDYEAWRSGADEAVSAAGDILADPEAYATHLDAMKRSGGAGLASALSRMREVLREDDRHMVEALAGRRKGGDAAAREEGIAHILDDPEKMRELRRQYEERKREETERKGRYQSRGRSM